MESVEWIGKNFIGLFEAGADTFIKLAKDFLPLIIIMLVANSSFIGLLGIQRIESFVRKLAKIPVINLMILPVCSILLQQNPLTYKTGSCLKEIEKPAFYDASVSFLHPAMALFPASNPGEIFVFWGIAFGVLQAGYSISSLAVRYFLCGILVAWLRSISTYTFTKIILVKRK
ncbi:PTS glucitol/sorbitol transporter subunit IIC [Enterococcus sp. AZ109]|uniref:PTS glucitol/sorbitol transporter subunit IIC n=1 Tax=Enterococcus sp. AZ109 TaxID=2774634 RepID=UPI003F23AB6C